MNNYSERVMRSKSNKVVKKVKEEPTKTVKKKKGTKKVKITNENVRYEILKKLSDIIIANRSDSELEDCKEFIYSRDIFARD